MHGASSQTLKEVEMGPYRVISSAPSKTMVRWLEEFESARLVVKQLTGITDQQVLPLTIILFEDDREFYELVPYDGTRSLVFSVGMTQQPLMAISLSGMG